MLGPEFDQHDVVVTVQHHDDGTVTYHWRSKDGSASGSSGREQPPPPVVRKIEPGPPVPDDYEPQSLKVRD